MTIVTKFYNSELQIFSESELKTFADLLKIDFDNYEQNIKTIIFRIVENYIHIEIKSITKIDFVSALTANNLIFDIKSVDIYFLKKEIFVKRNSSIRHSDFREFLQKIEKKM